MLLVQPVLKRRIPPPQLFVKLLLVLHIVEIEWLAWRKDDGLCRKVPVVWIVETIFSTKSVQRSPNSPVQLPTFNEVPH